MLPKRNSPDFSDVVGAVAQPTSGHISARIYYSPKTKEFRIEFTLNKARIVTHDGTTSGSYGSLKIFDFIKSAITILAVRQNYTAFVEGSALDTSAGDVVHVLGVGSAAISTARDGTLSGTENDLGTKTSQITNSGGTGTGSQVDGAKTTGLDGTGSAKSLYLNWSGTAATSDADSTIDVTGTITVTGIMAGAA